MEQMLHNKDYIALTLECLRASAHGGSYELMHEEALVDQIKQQLGRLDFKSDGETKHNVFCKIAAAAYIMSMRLDHVDKVYEK